MTKTIRTAQVSILLNYTKTKYNALHAYDDYDEGRLKIMKQLRSQITRN